MAVVVAGHVSKSEVHLGEKQSTGMGKEAALHPTTKTTSYLLGGRVEAVQGDSRASSPWTQALLKEQPCLKRFLPSLLHRSHLSQSLTSLQAKHSSPFNVP